MRIIYLFIVHQIPMYICRTVPSAVYTQITAIFYHQLLLGTYFFFLNNIYQTFSAFVFSLEGIIGHPSSPCAHIPPCVRQMPKQTSARIYIIPVRRFLFGFVVGTYKIFDNAETYFVVPLAQRSIDMHAYILNNFNS